MRLTYDLLLVPEPDLDRFVFFESKSDLGEIVCDDRGLDTVNPRKNDRFVTRYRCTKTHVEEGNVALI